MKVTGEIKEMAVSQRQMSAALGLSTARINQLVNEGILIKDPNMQNGALLLFDSVKNYYLSKNKGAEEVNLNEERALLMKAKRELAELKLSKARGELYSAKKVESAFLNLLMILRKNLQAMPARLSMKLAERKHEEVYEILMMEIESSLKELAEYDLSELGDDGDDDD